MSKAIDGIDQKKKRLNALYVSRACGDKVDPKELEKLRDEIDGFNYGAQKIKIDVSK